MLPIVMIRNEELWIAAVLTPLVQVCGVAVVGDTGSTDDTVAIVSRLPGAKLHQFGVLSPHELGQARRELSRVAGELGGSCVLQVDGDELYNVETLRWLQAQIPRPDSICGFTTMRSLDADSDGTLWEMADRFSRAAVLPVDCAWAGNYPYEVPAVFNDPLTHVHFSLPPGYRHHALHLHRLQRSRRDADVLHRVRKQYWFSMQRASVPRTVRFDMRSWQRCYS